jgi:glucose-6-phosphate isomerase
VVTDPGSPLDTSARGRLPRLHRRPERRRTYSALTAFGLVPSGLAGVDISELLDEAEATLLEVAIDDPRNPALVLAAAIAGSATGIPVATSSGSCRTARTSWACPTGSSSSSRSPPARRAPASSRRLLPLSPEVEQTPADLQLVRLVDDAVHFRLIEQHPDEILVSGSLGAQFVVWEYATAIAGRLLGINPFDQPDVESAKEAAGCSTRAPRPEPGVHGRRRGARVRCRSGRLRHPRGRARRALGSPRRNGYVAIQAYVDRTAVPQLAGLRELIAADSGRPTTFGWGPRFLHSTGQYHKGGPADGVFLQIIGAGEVDLEIPGRPFTFGQLIAAQAAGDASVLVAHGRPVVTLTLTDPQVRCVGAVRSSAVGESFR